jgi:hypothetical protein
VSKYINVYSTKKWNHYENIHRPHPHSASIPPHSFLIRFFRITKLVPEGDIYPLAIPNLLHMTHNSLFIIFQSPIYKQQSQMDIFVSLFVSRKRIGCYQSLSLEINKRLVRKGNKIPSSESTRPGKIQTIMYTSPLPYFQAAK